MTEERWIKITMFLKCLRKVPSAIFLTSAVRSASMDMCMCFWVVHSSLLWDL